MNILCPVSDEKTNEKIVRYIALITFLIALVFIYSPNILLVTFLALDFLARGFGLSQYSVLFQSGTSLINYIPFKSKKIDKAPKIFAARIGFILSLLAVVLMFSDAVLVSKITIFVLAFFALLEWSARFCMGCYIYSWIILPYFSKR